MQTTREDSNLTRFAWWRSVDGRRDSSVVGYMSIEEQVDADFDRARRRAFLRRVRARLRGIPVGRLLPGRGRAAPDGGRAPSLRQGCGTGAQPSDPRGSPSGDQDHLRAARGGTRAPSALVPRPRRRASGRRGLLRPQRGYAGRATPPEELLSHHPHARRADPEAVTAVIAAVAGFFTGEGLRPAPPGLPTLRKFQAAQGELARGWLARRTGWG
jgi:hypothetical protein